MEKPCIIYITCANEQEAKLLARELLHLKLIACANIIPSISSMYLWEEQIKEESECLMIMKTTDNQYEAVQNLIIKLHSYNTPCIIKINIANGEKNFIKWIANSVKCAIIH